MMKQHEQHGIGFCGVLALIFICLKLAGIGVVATWSWWWVLAPLWIPAAFVVAMLAAIGILYVIAGSVGRK